MKNELDALRQRFENRTPGLLGAKKEFAVLCPVVELKDGLHLIFEVRSNSVSQAGEVCFPGGKLENGESPVDGALRETWEELAIPKEEISIIGMPDYFFNHRGALLHPVLGLVSEAGHRSIRPSAAEVAEVFTVPLSFFRDNPPQLYHYETIPQIPADFPYEAIGVSPDYPWHRGRQYVPVWLYEGHAIWGMTGRIVMHLMEEA